MKITLLGQSTLLLEMSGLRMLTDPWWGRFEFLRGVPMAADPDLLERLDLMLVSHNHVDHWSKPAIMLARRQGATVVGSQKAARRAVTYRLPDVVAMKPGDRRDFRGVTINAVPAFHPFARDAIGFVVEGEKNLYFSGDTRREPRLVEALKRFQLDVALLQVACSTYPLVGKDGMDLESAALLAAEVGPALVIPIHYQVKGKVLDDEELEAWKPLVPVAILKPGVPLQL